MTPRTTSRNITYTEDKKLEIQTFKNNNIANKNELRKTANFMLPKKSHTDTILILLYVNATVKYNHRK